MHSETNILVIRHEHCTTLGMLQPSPQGCHSNVRYLNVFQGETLEQPVTHYSHIVVLGGTIGAYEDDRYPFLREEFKLLETAIAHHLPIVGICLGSQILARLLGARVYRGEAGREAGWCEVQLTEAARHDPLLKGFPPHFRVFQSHQDTFDLPIGAVHLAQSDRYPNQAFRYDDHIWALQFHLEFDDQVLAGCAALIEQELKLSNIAETTLDQLLAEAKHYSPLIAPIADRFMQSFLEREMAIAAIP